MKIAIVHDDLVQWGGAERVLLAISEVFPDAPIYTSIYDEDNLLLEHKFVHKKIITSFMQKIPGWRSFYKALLPLYPIAFEQFDFSEYDLVISQTTRFAKSIITKPNTKHICYCHTPPRFLWNFSGEKVSRILWPILSYLRVYDQISAKRVDKFLAGSENSKKRIKKIYGVDSEVLYPFVDLERYKEVESFDGGYFLIVTRLNKYKRVDIAIDTFEQLGWTLKIVGTGPESGGLKRKAGLNIEFLGSLSEEVLINLIAGCKALIVTAEEDFGLTPLEAQACGKPVIAFGEGGALETVVEGKTGLFFEKQTEESLTQVLKEFDTIKFRAGDCIKNAEKFSKSFFIKELERLVGPSI